MQNILLVSHSPFPANSAIHVHHFANELIKLGLDCVVAVPAEKENINQISGNLYQVTQYDEIGLIPKLFANQQPPDIVHAWTPRQHVRDYCYALSMKYEFKLVIHLEDNEESITERFLDTNLKTWSAEDETRLPYNLTHPFKYQEFLANADGATIIIDKLGKFIPSQLPTITLFPGVDSTEFYPRAKNPQLLAQYKLKPETTVLVYTGNVHLANIEEVRELYLAVGNLNRAGIPTVLIRSGYNCDLPLLSPEQQWINKYVINLGWIERSQIAEILALADILVQPGKTDEFNDYRFPSKIPEFLAMGKPTIVPKTNIGLLLTDRENALVLDGVNRDSLPVAVKEILANKQLQAKLANNSLEFARKQLNWTASGQKLARFYQSLCVPEKEVSALRNALTRARTYYQELEESKEKYYYNQLEIEAMKTSKFWKLRDKWFQIKRLLKLTQE